MPTSQVSDFGFSIRLVQESDAAQIAKIFEPITLETAISFTTEVLEPSDFVKKMRQVLPHRPWLVAESNSEVLGYAYASEHRSLGAYRWTSEVSIYIDQRFRNQGVAQKLYSTLFRILAAQGFYKCYAGITLPNDASIALHKRFQFRHFATFQNIGFKLGQWRDVSWWELDLKKDLENLPSEPISALEILKGNPGLMTTEQ